MALARCRSCTTGMAPVVSTLGCLRGGGVVGCQWRWGSTCPCPRGPASLWAQVELFNAAVKAQVQGVKLCSEGMGVERHLYSLKCLAEERGLEVPKVLRSKARGAARACVGETGGLQMLLSLPRYLACSFRLLLP